MSKYQKLKEAARQKAVEWSLGISQRPMSWMECARWGEFFENLGRRYGLLREFHENGIC